MSQRAAAAVDRAVAALRAGEPILVHDFADREGETDVVYPAGAVTPDAVSRLRNDAGGLVCVALSDSVCAALDLPLLDAELAHPSADDHDLGYDERSSFSLSVNHRETYTGVTDADRARTITALSDAASVAGDGYGPAEFADAFRSPGHVRLLRGAPGLLASRRGHTELGLALAAAAERPPAVVVCEMLDDETGGALSPDDARAYARRHGLPYVEGADVLDRLG
jgi:3,4-dihydroxy 2-butanone 4-phosphate synthase